MPSVAPDVQERSQLLSRIRRLLGFARLTLVDDTGEHQRAQALIRALGPNGVEEVLDGVWRLGEYGLATCPPEGAQAAVLSLGGNPSLAVIVATGDRATRMKNLTAGESALYNGPKGTHVYLKDDGSAEINAPTAVTHPLSATQLHAGNGASGSFTSQDGKHITVVDGIITLIA